MARLSISQVPGSDPPQFLVRNRDTDQSAPPAVVPSPDTWPVNGTGTDPLMLQLGWLLETFLSYPFSPYTERAACIQESLKQWGQTAFNALFNNRDAGQWLSQASDAVFDILITCDDPKLLAWPWEALLDPKLGPFAHRARIQRRLSHQVPNPPALPDLPKEAIHILLITARPYDQDVDYRSISRPLVDLVSAENLPVKIDLLRPPTLDQLRAHLQARPNHYHILHFDGHGGYGGSAPAASSSMFRGSEGRLLFETPDGKPHEVTARQLTLAFQGSKIPFVVLNACRSAQLDAQAVDGQAVASVAGALVQAGFRAVLAMTYNLTVTGAQAFLPPFYRQLFRTGSLMEAAREGRSAMVLHPQRSAWNPSATLPDWLLPVVYQQREDYTLPFAQTATTPTEEVPLPAQATIPETLTFVGRDQAIQALERSLRRRPAATLVHGLGGIGKTTLIRHFLQWLRSTGGLTQSPFWFSFDDIRSTSYILNDIGRPLFGTHFDADNSVAYQKLIQRLRSHSFLLVFDNFESACGFQPEHVSGLLTSDDQARLLTFIQDLHGGKTKILITSRSPEDWLPTDHCRRLPLRGLHPDEVWEYAAQVLESLDITTDKNDPDLQDLLKDLEGHPVLIRAVLAQLTTRSPATLRQQWRDNLPTFLAQVSDPSHARLLATLDLITQTFPPEEKACLIPLALHERYVDLNLIHLMGEEVIPGYIPATKHGIITRLVQSGLLTLLGGSIYSCHPLFTSYSRLEVLPLSFSSARDCWEKRFVYVMSNLADGYTPKEIQQQRRCLQIHHINLHSALSISQRYELDSAFAAISQFLAVYALRTKEHSESIRLYTILAEHGEKIKNGQVESSAYHQLGIIAQDQHDSATAEFYYLKSLALKNEKCNGIGLGSTYHQLGRIAQERHDLTTAEQWYQKSLSIKQQSGDENQKTSTYHQLGRIALERRNYTDAVQWVMKGLIISEKEGNENEVAMSYHQLGRIAQEQKKFCDAKKWYSKSLEIKVRIGNQNETANTYHQLGIIAEINGDIDSAETLYLQSLAISEKYRNASVTTGTYHQLGSIALQRGDYQAAEQWCIRSLGINEIIGNTYGKAITCHQLGVIAHHKKEFVTSEKWYLDALACWNNIGDTHKISIIYHQLGANSQERLDFDSANEWYSASLALSVHENNDHLTANTYGQMAIIALAKNEFLQSALLFSKAFILFGNTHDEPRIALTFDSLARLIRTVPNEVLPKVIQQLQDSLGQELAQQVVEAAEAPA